MVFNISGIINLLSTRSNLNFTSENESDYTSINIIVISTKVEIQCIFGIDFPDITIIGTKFEVVLYKNDIQFVNLIFKKYLNISYITDVDKDIICIRNSLGRFINDTERVCSITNGFKTIISLQIPNESIKWKLNPDTIFTLSFTYNNFDNAYDPNSLNILSTDDEFGSQLASQLKNIIITFLINKIPNIIEIRNIAEKYKKPIKDIIIYDPILYSCKIKHKIINFCDKDVICPICQIDLNDDENIINVEIECKHKYHLDCLHSLLNYDIGKNGINCCLCTKRFGGYKIGTQPSNGTMNISEDVNIQLPEESECGVYIIKYFIPGNKDYNEQRWTAYLPLSKKGLYVLNLLKIAFDRQLIFRLGNSSTHNFFGICWAIHHKTSIINGTHSYPDTGYLDRVIDELSSVGVISVDETYISNEIELDVIIDDSGFFGYISNYFVSRFETLNLFCIVCDKPLKFYSKIPTCCTNDICRFGFKELGVGRNLNAEMKFQQNILHLLITFLFHASISSRWSIIINPFPNFDNVNIKNDIKMKIVNGIIKYPSISSLNVINDESIWIKQLHKWILQSNTAYIISLKITHSSNIFMSLLNTSNILYFRRQDIDEKFENDKKLYGSTFCFHGSPLCNWHSILRSNLVVGTSTNKLLINGNVYGTGIYVSPNLNTSMTYSKSLIKSYTLNNNTNTWLTSLNACVSVCEVINNNYKICSDDIWIVKDESKLVMRFLILYKVGDKHTKINSVENNILFNTVALEQLYGN